MKEHLDPDLSRAEVATGYQSKEKQFLENLETS